jgi:hypothetical protein
MVASTKLLHLLEAFSTPWFLYASPTNHHLVFFLLEAFNNIIQYQFDGNSNLIYTIIRKRTIFHQLANLPTDHSSIAKALTKRGKKFVQPGTVPDELPMEGSVPAAEAEPGTLQATLAATPGIDKMTETSTTSVHSGDQLATTFDSGDAVRPTAAGDAATGPAEQQESSAVSTAAAGLASCSISTAAAATTAASSAPSSPNSVSSSRPEDSTPEGMSEGESSNDAERRKVAATPVKQAAVAPSLSPTSPVRSVQPQFSERAPLKRGASLSSNSGGPWVATPEWVQSWKQKLPLQTIMRLLQVLVPQVEKICIDKGLTDESEILKFLQHGTLVGLLPVPHPILIRKYQANTGTNTWFRTYMWGIIFLRNIDPPIWYDTDVKLFEIQRL